MQPERWQRIDQLFHLALEQERDQRPSFLAQACAGDEALQSDIEELISSHEQAENFIETPASDLAAELLAKGGAGIKAGETIGPYRVESVLGIGGMGEVYLAHDTRLGRQVALKLLPPQFTIDPGRVRRFEQEARTASALNHPNIVTIHEIGRINGSQFIVTEFVDGQTLRQRMTEKRLRLHAALDVAIQVANALEAAHAAGIVHRDIKPENIMLRADGYVKVLDFGLAKLTERKNAASDPGEATRTLVKTNPGMVMGTVQYMSPEQAQAKEVDVRTDIWSLGVVLYEMVAGRAPFDGETPSHVIVSILETEPALLVSYSEAPAELERIVTKALRKHRKERYQTASDLVLDLKSLKQELEVEARLQRSLDADAVGKETRAESVRRIVAKTVDESGADASGVAMPRPTSSAEYLVGEIKRHRLGVTFAAAAVVIAVLTVSYFWYTAKTGAYSAGSNEAIDSVAVLPFVNVNNDPNTEYLSDGISDSIINSLSRLPALRVMSLNSVLRYKGKQADPQTIGKGLNVRAVLLGRLTQQGDSLLISAELVDARDNRRLWGEQYNRKLADILVIQEEIAREIAANLRLRLTREQQQQLTRRYTDNARAYQLYSMGSYQARLRTKAGAEKAIEYFDQAIQIDPNYTLAYTGLCLAYNVLGVQGFWIPKEARQKVEWAALKAVELDDARPEAHLWLGYVKKLDWDWAGAEKEMKRALELDPDVLGANVMYYTFLLHMGRTDEALAYAKRADELDVESALPSFQAEVYLFARRFDMAIELYKPDVEKNPKCAVCHRFLAESYLGRGMYAEAVDELQKALALNNEAESWQGYPLLAYAYAKAGRREDALKVLDEQKRLAQRGYISPYNFVIMYTGLGDKDRAFEFLNKAFEERVPSLYFVPNRPIFDSLHSDPRFAEFLRRVNLPSLIKS